MYAQVILSRVNSFIDRPFTYSIPDEIFDEATVGRQVVVPFGKRFSVGYIIRLTKEPPEGIKNIKEIKEIRGDIALFDEKTVEAAAWMSDTYISMFGTALHAMLPPGIKSMEKVRGRKRIMVEGDPGKKAPEPRGPAAPHVLPGDLETAAKAIAFDVDKRAASCLLLYGDPGRHKAAMYVRIVADILAGGKGAIVLFPELYRSHIAATELYRRFKDTAAVLHSAMTDDKKIKEWERIRKGEARLVIGTRNAVFAPVEDLGLILIDQEEEFTYKQEQNPKYHAREAALFIGKQRKVSVVLASACPSLETFYKAGTGEYKMIRLDGLQKPDISLIDMRSEENRKKMLSPDLINELDKCFSGNGRAILIMNRRGYAPYMACAVCGSPIECPHCSVALIFHSVDRHLRCHKCNYSSEVPLNCAKCGGTELRYSGTGTQKVQSEIGRYFPHIKVLRLDRDSASGKDARKIAIDMFAEGDAQLLIGTQMAASALEKAEAELVGIVSADTALYGPDFRSAENTFRLMMSASGAGIGGNVPKKMVIQTDNTDHYVFDAAKRMDYAAFFDEEIKMRKSSSYPPFSNIISVAVYGTEQAAAENAALEIAKKLKDKKVKGVSVLGPAQTALAKVKGRNRWQILIKGPDLDIIKTELREITGTERKKKKGGDVRVSIDVDPISV